MNKEEFKKKLEAFDWYYEFSDDPGVFRRGLKEFDELEALASGNEAFNTMLNVKLFQVNQTIRKED